MQKFDGMLVVPDLYCCHRDPWGCRDEVLAAMVPCIEGRCWNLALCLI